LEETASFSTGLLMSDIKNGSSMRKLILPALFLSVFLFQIPGRTDISWEMLDTGSENGYKKVIKQKIFIAKDKFAIENESGEKFIIDLILKKVFYVNKTEKSYYSMDIDKMASISNPIDKDTESIIDDALKNIPESQRAQYKKMMEEKIRSRSDSLAASSGFPDPSLFKPTGRSKNIIGHDTKEYKATDKSGNSYDVWCSKEIDTKEIIDFYKRIESSGLSGKINMKNTMVPMGFPLVYNFKKGTDSYSSEIISINTNILSDSIFKIPDGFTKKDTISR